MDTEGHRIEGPRKTATGEAMRERIGPFIVPTAEGRLALIYDYERVPLDDVTIEHWWWQLSLCMKRIAEEKRRANAKVQ